MPYLLFSMTKITGSFQSLAMLKRLVDLALVGRAVAEIGEADVAVAAVLVGEGSPVPSGTWAPTMPCPP